MGMNSGNESFRNQGESSSSGRKPTLVLKFKQRRYDGGSEIELIRNIERKQAEQYQGTQFSQSKAASERTSAEPLSQQLADSQPTRQATLPVNPMTAAAPLDSGKAADFSRPATATEQSTESATQDRHVSKPRKALEALVMGPLEICVALLGLLTSSLAIVMFFYMNHQELFDRSRHVFQECWKTLGQGLLHCLTGPGTAVKQLFA